MTMFAHHLFKGKLPGHWIVIFLATWLAGGSLVTAAEHGMIHWDAARKIVTLSDAQGQLALRLNYAGRCVLDQVTHSGIFLL